MIRIARCAALIWSPVRSQNGCKGFSTVKVDPAHPWAASHIARISAGAAQQAQAPHRFSAAPWPAQALPAVKTDDTSTRKRDTVFVDRLRVRAVGGNGGSGAVSLWRSAAKGVWLSVEDCVCWQMILKLGHAEASRPNIGATCNNHILRRKQARTYRRTAAAAVTAAR